MKHHLTAKLLIAAACSIASLSAAPATARGQTYVYPNAGYQAYAPVPYGYVPYRGRALAPRYVTPRTYQSYYYPATRPTRRFGGWGGRRADGYWPTGRGIPSDKPWLDR